MSSAHRRVAASWSSGVARSDSSSAVYSDSGKLSFASFTPRAQIAALSYACVDTKHKVSCVTVR